MKLTDSSSLLRRDVFPFLYEQNFLGSGVAHSVYCLATGWTTGVRTPAEIKGISSSLCVQTVSEAHPLSCTVGTGGPFPGGKAAGTCS
jgi:hypothetical protein